LMIHLAPGDPAAVMVGGDVAIGSEELEAVHHRLGLDRPLGIQMAKWVIGVLKGDLGYSFFLATPVISALFDRLPVTTSLSLCAIIFAVLLGIPLGVVASLRPNTLIDTATMTVALLGVSSPGFLTGLALVFFFGVRLHWLPVGGYESFTRNFPLALRHILMPAFSLGIAQAALIARITRASMLDVLSSEYVRTARSKGMTEQSVIWKHAFRNSLLPIVTVVGMSFAALLAGSFIIEAVFVLPGVGNLIISAVKQRDYPVVQGGVLFVASIVLLGNLLVDCSYLYIDPRVTYE